MTSRSKSADGKMALTIPSRSASSALSAARGPAPEGQAESPAVPAEAAGYHGPVTPRATTIETARLILRPFSADDFDDLYAYQSHTDVARYLTWEARDRVQVRRALEEQCAETTLDAEGKWLTFRHSGSGMEGAGSTGTGLTIIPPDDPPGYTRGPWGCFTARTKDPI
jgi:RimJ/RimL family protein N-acetyltransferase